MRQFITFSFKLSKIRVVNETRLEEGRNKFKQMNSKFKKIKFFTYLEINYIGSYSRSMKII